MSNWKIKRSRKAGVIPNVNHFPDADTLIWNQADGKLWGLHINNDGNKSVVLIGGGVDYVGGDVVHSPGGQTHARLHAIDGEQDHLPAGFENYGDIIRASPEDGKIQFYTLVSFGTKRTNVDAGEFKQISFDQNWIYFCTTPGEAETAVWKKFPLLKST